MTSDNTTFLEDNDPAQPTPSPGAVVTGASSLDERFTVLKDRVLAKRPILRSILKKKGNKPLYEYSNEYVDVNLNPTIMKRQHECLSTIHEATKERYGEETADGVVAQLEKHYFVSTADHVGPMVHPFFVNSNILTALAQEALSDPTLRYLVVLACANISLNNSSFPRGLFFNSYKNDTLRQHRLAFLPSNSHSSSVYNFRPYTKQEIAKVENQLEEIAKTGEVEPAHIERLHDLIRSVYATPEILAAGSYREQVAKTNRQLWKKFFEKSDAKIPELLYLDQEDIVVRLLTKYHLTQDTVLNHILFDPTYEPYINANFEGIFGSFSRKDAVGTYLFWALPKGEKLNKQLWRKGNYLVTKNESYKIELHPEAIREAMLNKELVPSLLLNFMTISFYYGLKCLGGFSQVNYLTLMKNSYIKMNADLSNYRSIETCARAQTKEICCGLSLAFLGYNENSIGLASGIDLFLHSDADSWNKIRALSKKITLEESLNPLMPDIYRISYDEKEWEPDLLQLTNEDITRHTGLRNKIDPCISLS